jgi:hypothetical protein
MWHMLASSSMTRIFCRPLSDSIVSEFLWRW